MSALSLVSYPSATGRTWRAIYVALLVLASSCSFAGASSLDQLQSALSASLPQSAQNALARIPDPKRRLLALRSYAKAGDALEAQWSWSAAQIRAFEASPDFERMQAAVNELTRAFEQQNPGYSLYTNTQVRSLDLQIERWNSNPGVKLTSEMLFNYVSTQVAQHKAKTPDQLRTLLLNWHPAPAAPLAAPGLSAHGQMRALDFQIIRGKDLVAGTSTSSVTRVWEHDGWADRLHQAVLSIGNKFEGPLRSPNEPWHYRYVP